MTTQLVHLNSLNLNEKHIWISLDDNSDFSYSDGADEERYLIDVLTDAGDVSLDSAELRRACRDWVSEYHLSAVRANLLKTVNFPDNAKVLEVGCGCGALTRYLGEQGFVVDAVEGSAARAEISSLRCKDLDNVQIIQHNFNTLNLPQAHYDVVLFIGVLEYALRFIDEPEFSPEQAVESLLEKAAASLSLSGCMLVAIENRTGLKYVKGAFEDHLALPDVGINNYEGYEFTGIKTYDQSQWQTIIDNVGLKHRLFFPFADYKFPNLIINNTVPRDDTDYLSNQIYSQDPISPWSPEIQENERWAEIIAAGKLEQASNSFGLAVAKSDSALKDIFNSDWAFFDKVEIKPALRRDLGYKNTKEINNNNNELRQVINHKPDYSNALNRLWMQHLTDKPELETFNQITRSLARFLTQHNWQHKLIDFDQFYTSANGQQFEFSRFWQTNTQYSLSQQLFHILIEFCIKNKAFLAAQPSFNYLSISDILTYCLNQQRLADLEILDEPLSELTHQEQQFRNLIHISPRDVEDDMNYILSTHDAYQFKHITSQLFYSAQADVFSADQSITVRAKQGMSIQSCLFNEIKSKHHHLRFDPCDHEHGKDYYFCLHSIYISNPDHGLLQHIQGESLFESIVSVHDLDLICKSHLIYKVSGIDSQIKFSLAPDLTKITDRYNVEIKLQWLGV